MEDEIEGTLDFIAPVHNGFLGAGDSVHGNGFDALLILHGRKGRIADGVIGAADSRDDCASGGQLLGVFAGVFGAGNGFEAVTSTRSALAANACDFKVGASDFAPIGDFSFEKWQ